MSIFHIFVPTNNFIPRRERIFFLINDLFISFLLPRKNMGANTISSALNAHAGNMNGNGNGNGNGNVSLLPFSFLIKLLYFTVLFEL